MKCWFMTQGVDLLYNCSETNQCRVQSVYGETIVLGPGLGIPISLHPLETPSIQGYLYYINLSSAHC